MAELQRYQQTGRVFSDLPQLDFTNLRQGVQTSQSMQQALDRVTKFAYEAAGEQAQQQAEQFSVENPITIEQVKFAQQSGIDMMDLMPKGGKIYQDTLRKFQGEQLRADLELEGRNAYANILAQVEAGLITNPNDLKMKLESPIVGLSTPLQQINPESAIKFRQSMATVGSQVYTAATKKFTDDYINGNKLQVEQAYPSFLTIAKTTIANVQDPIMLEEQLKLSEIALYNKAKEGGTDFALQTVEKFRKEYKILVTDSFIQRATDPAFAGNMFQALDKVRAGDFGDRTILFNSLTVEEQSKVRAAVNQRWLDTYNSQKAVLEAEKLANKEENDSLIINLYTPGGITGQAQRRAAAEKLFRDDAITKNDFDEIVNPKPKDDEVDLSAARAESDIIYGRITSEAQLNSFYPGLSAKSRVKLLPKIASESERRATKVIYNAAGASESPFAVLDDNKAKKVQTMTQLKEEAMAETNSDGSPKYSPVQAAGIAVEKWQDSAEVKTAARKQKRNLDSVLKVAPDFNIDSMNIDDYAARKGLSADIVARIKPLIKSYNDAKNITGHTADQVGNAQ